MYGNESRHPGRPHVKVHLKDDAISVSLDDPPQILTPTGGMRGERSAIKTVKKYRQDFYNYSTRRAPTPKSSNPRD